MFADYPVNKNLLEQTLACINNVPSNVWSKSRFVIPQIVGYSDKYSIEITYLNDNIRIQMSETTVNGQNILLDLKKNEISDFSIESKIFQKCNELREVYM